MLVLRTVSEVHTRYRAYHSRSRKNRHIDRPVLSAPGRYTPRTKSLSRPIKRTYSAEVTGLRRNLPHHRRLRPSRRSYILLQNKQLVNQFFQKKSLTDPTKTAPSPLPFSGKKPTPGRGLWVNPGRWRRRRHSPGFPGRPGGRGPGERAGRGRGFSGFPAPAWNSPGRSSHTCCAPSRGRAAG